MRDDERLFSFGVAFFLFALLAIAIFNSAFNASDKKLKIQNARIIRLEQEAANASVRFRELIRPEVLRPIVMRTFPDFKPIGTGRTISVKDIE
ncbi:MAG: hypothetical protein LBB08_01140 [Rickettsiales bacterium]|jgi:hypothetical protein|nr:hypothetical protein [Rickettsiales bacterium]